MNNEEELRKLKLNNSNLVPDVKFVGFLAEKLEKVEKKPLDFGNVQEWIVHKERTEIHHKDTWDHCPKPFDDEVFSSYITRAAKMNFAEPLPIIKKLENRQIASTRYDMDLRIRLETIKKISQFLNQQEDILIDMCLFLKSSSYRDNIVLYGSRYCPFCLEEDGEHPYFRFYWRLNFISVCTKHNCYLQDICPKCGADVRYWDTKFDQSILECYKCGENLINAKNKVKRVRAYIENRTTFRIFQDILINIYKSEEWRGELINREKFFRKVWKLAWVENNKPFIDSEKNYETSYEKYIKNTIKSTIKTFKAIYSAFKIMQSDYERLEKPFVCSNDGKKFISLMYFLRHLHTHNNVVCPLEDCGSSKTEIYHGHYKCMQCGTEFTSNGDIIKKGKIISCPLEECGGNSFRIRENDIRCGLCGTIFMIDGMIKKKGKKMICPLEECKSNNIRAYSKDKYKCFVCGTIFRVDGNIVEAGSRVKCLLKDCQSEDVRIKNNGYRCEKCGSLYSANNRLLKKGKIKIPRCPLKECRSKSVRKYKNHLLCYRCGTIFNREGKVLNKGKRQICPLEECGSTRTRIKNRPIQKFIFICRICGTEFSSSGDIFKKGKKVICPSLTCRSKRTRANIDSYFCEKCHIKFTIDGKIIKENRRLTCPLETCRSRIISKKKRLSYNICKKCGTEFTSDGIILKKGERKVCPFCGSKNTQADDGEYFCVLCHSKFTIEGKIIEEGKKVKCPLKTCGTKNITFRKQKSCYICKVCGTEFTSDGTILKKRVKQVCPLCGSNYTRFKFQSKERDEFRCLKCGTEFTIDNKIIKKGKRVNCPKCNSPNTKTWLSKEGYVCRHCGKNFF
ncbi:MAG: TniQ family protein [Promethearchaeota archaeon]